MNKVNSYKNRIFLLTGFMGSGKSFLGRKAADKFGCDFVDLDELIEEQESCSIAEIFKEKGEEYFREIETKYFSHIIGCENKLIIIAGGGGFPLKKENQQLMKKVATIFVDTEFNIILSRLNSGEKRNRPLLKNKDEKEIKNLYEKRLNVYKSTADYVVTNETELITLINSLIKANYNE